MSNQQENVKKSTLELKAMNVRNDIAFIRKQLEAIEAEIGKTVRTQSEYGFDASYISEKVEKAKHALDSIVEVST